MTEGASWQFAKKQTEKIHGWLSDIENMFLYETAGKLKQRGVIVEIGSWKGRSTICLALGSKSGAKTKIYAIDPHTGSPDLIRPGEKIWTYDAFIKNIKSAGVADLIIPIVATAEEAIKNWRLPVALIFIDANYHDYKLTANLLREWIPHVIDGGIIALNNAAPSFGGILQNKPLTGLPGPRRAASEYIFRSNHFKNRGLAGAIAYGEKCGQNNFWDKVAGIVVDNKVSLYFLLYKIYLLLTKLPAPIKYYIKARL